ncbi:peroxisomal membrane protein 4 isoform X5 [Camelus bactrianus]|uniref:Peroxisomal membrane protein 4 isoform X5 n=2 Tax=Camelus TaxID=9836 RepID=A0AC58NZQ6_CAMBA
MGAKTGGGVDCPALQAVREDPGLSARVLLGACHPAARTMAAPPQLQTLLLAVNALLRKRRYHAVLAMLKGFRNGAVYGAKIRAPHALVMTFLFRSGRYPSPRHTPQTRRECGQLSVPGLLSLQEKLRAILQATYTHSRNLASFVFTYKGLCALQSHLQGETYQVHSFLAAFIGGLLVFGNNSTINSQINMYLMSRILFALCRLGMEKGYIPEPRYS